MKITTNFSLAAILMAVPSILAWGQQANVNLDYNPQKDTEGLIPFSAPLNSPDVRDDHTVMFRLKAPEAKEVKLTGAVLTALGAGREGLCRRSCGEQRSPCRW